MDREGGERPGSGFHLSQGKGLMGGAVPWQWVRSRTWCSSRLLPWSLPSLASRPRAGQGTRRGDSGTLRLEAELMAGLDQRFLASQSFSCSLEAPVRLLEDTDRHLHPET